MSFDQNGFLSLPRAIPAAHYTEQRFIEEGEKKLFAQECQLVMAAIS
jgi:hypothetical protein